MCLTIPKKVISINGDDVVVENPNGTRQNSKSILELAVGDYCLSQQGIIIEKLDKEDAQTILNILINKGGKA
jgi:hydrogenase maturation factor